MFIIYLLKLTICFFYTLIWDAFHSNYSLFIFSQMEIVRHTHTNKKKILSNAFQNIKNEIKFPLITKVMLNINCLWLWKLHDRFVCFWINLIRAYNYWQNMNQKFDSISRYYRTFLLIYITRNSLTTVNWCKIIPNSIKSKIFECH